MMAVDLQQGLNRHSPNSLQLAMCSVPFCISQVAAVWRERVW